MLRASSDITQNPIQFVDVVYETVLYAITLEIDGELISRSIVSFQDTFRILVAVLDRGKLSTVFIQSIPKQTPDILIFI